MSAKSLASWQNITAARTMLQELARGLRDHQGVIDRVASKVGDQIQAVETSFLERHVDTGAALSSQEVTIDGGLVVTHRARYLDFVPGNPMRRGRMSPFIVKRAAELMASEFLATIGHGEGTIGAIATKLVEGVAARTAKKASAAAARVERKAAKKAEREAARATKKAERKAARTAERETRKAQRKAERAAAKVANKAKRKAESAAKRAAKKAANNG